jgi:hypothetical protein
VDKGSLESIFLERGWKSGERCDQRPPAFIHNGYSVFGLERIRESNFGRRETMSSGIPYARKKLRFLKEALFEAAKIASRRLEPNSLAVLVRKPILDEDCPEVSDVDLISVWENPEELPERITVESRMGRVFVDVLWYLSRRF